MADSALYFINPHDRTFKLILSSPPIVPIQAPDWEVRNVLTVDNDLNLYVGGEEGILVVKLDAPDAQGSTSIRVFPNPVAQGVAFTVCSDFEFKIVTVSGMKVGEYSAGCHSMESTSFSPGLYVIINSSGEKGKFLVKGQ